jgi:organic radical activating enzyme
MYYHIDNATPCHLIRNNLNQSPEEYLNGPWLKNLKQEFVDGKFPDVCGGCKSRENLGLKSTRRSVWKDHFKVEGDESLDISEYTVDKKTDVYRFEILFSNLCNFKCRICTEECSSSIAKENTKFGVPNSSPLFQSIKSHKGVAKSPKENFEELKNVCLHSSLRKLVLTGGEPLLIKECYEILDFIIEQNLTDTVILELYTNCSVYNLEFINRMLKFKKVNFVMSIDGTEKTAEYQRHGTNWKVVKNNILKFNSLPISRLFNTAISGYVLLDVSSLATFLMKLYEQNNEIQTRCYSVSDTDDCHWKYMDTHLREIAIKEIDKALEILTVKNFYLLSKELQDIKTVLQNTSPITPHRFVKFTENLDKMRGESFEETFGCKLIKD